MRISCSTSRFILGVIESGLYRGTSYTYLTDYALSELVKYVMEDTGCSIEEAMERVYNSPLMTALQDEEGELYVQSPAYLYELMKQ